MEFILRAFVLLVPGMLALRAATQCRRQHKTAVLSVEARVWAGLAVLFLLMAFAKVLRELGYLRVFGDFLRQLAKYHGLYDDRRMFQVFVSIAVIIASLALFIYGLSWAWHNFKRYRLALGLTGLIVGFGFVRFVSLHEVDAWIASAPWFGFVLETVVAAGVSTIALLRLRQHTSFR